MDLVHVDWLPLRFWLAALGGTSILILGLLAVGAIDDGASDDMSLGDMRRAVLLRDIDEALCRSRPIERAEPAAADRGSIPVPGGSRLHAADVN